MGGAVPISVALVAGGLAVINPCSFPLLPAFLSFYVGAEETKLPRTATRVAQGLLVGGLVTTGFLGLFALIGLPVSLGAGAIARTVPWAGLATGALLAAVGLIALAGITVRSPLRLKLAVRRERHFGAMLIFGVGYGAASLGCTLPIFLTLIGASLGGSKVAVFLAYGIGMAVVLMSVSVAVALMRDGVTRFLRPLLPHMSRIAGALLVVSGVYLTYYWARIRFGDTATLADDPIVGGATRYAAQVQSYASDHSTPLLIGAACFLIAATATSLWKWHQSATRTLVRE
jgi:cytochrome c biogenesis protein CcdA